MLPLASHHALKKPALTSTEPAQPDEAHRSVPVTLITGAQDAYSKGLHQMKPLQVQPGAQDVSQQMRPTMHMFATLHACVQGFWGPERRLWCATFCQPSMACASLSY